MMNRFFAILVALGLIIVGTGAFVACLSYHSADVSLNTASVLPVRNVLGAAGAYTADVLLQLFGVPAFLLTVAGAVFGVLILRRVRWIKFRVYMVLLAVLAACWLLGDGTAEAGRWTKAGVGGYIGFYLSGWVPANVWWIQTIGWTVVVLLIVLCLKVPVVTLCRWSGRAAVQNAGRIKISLPKRRVKDVLTDDVAPAPKEEKIKMKSAPKERKEPTMTTPVKKEKKSTFVLPPVDLLAPLKGAGTPTITKETMACVSAELEEVLSQYQINGKIVGVRPGPVVSLYEFEPVAGLKTSRVIALSDDIAREMRVVSVRISVVSGSNTIGIEMPNAKRDMVSIRDLVDNTKFKNNPLTLPLVLGKDIGGTPVYADLAKMPHLLVAGTTGSGKSVAINTMILSLLYRFKPAECRLILVDPKMVELSVYNNIPHLLIPVVTEAPKAVMALKWAVREMEDRYRAMSQLGVRNIDGYNQKLAAAAAAGQTLTRRVQTGFNPETGKPIFEEQNFDLTPIPYIVMIVDEMADLMGQCRKEAEGPIQRLAQMARAVGIHLILATQRPSVDVITGIIKANFPTRISFQVTNKIDSRTILDEQGAEQLLGKGDMLYRPAGQKPQRIHGPFVSDQDVERVVTHLTAQGEPHYLDAVLADTDGGETGGGVGAGAPASSGDDLYDQAVAIILRDKKVSTSYVQRQLRIGYNKAADLIDRMEAEGVISKPNVAGKREILVPTDNA